MDIETLLDRIDTVSLSLSKAQGVNSLLEAAYRSGKVSEDHFTCANLVVFDALTDASKLIDELWEHLKAATGGYSKEAA